MDFLLSTSVYAALGRRHALHRYEAREKQWGDVARILRFQVHHRVRDVR